MHIIAIRLMLSVMIDMPHNIVINPMRCCCYFPFLFCIKTSLKIKNKDDSKDFCIS